MRYLYSDVFSNFLRKDSEAIFAELVDNYHGEIISTTKEAWKSEIALLKNVLVPWSNKNAQIIFEYNIPRLGKRIDVVLLFRGIVFCLEFKVGESSILEADVDQVLDYALDLKYFHKFSQDKIIVPILIATQHQNASTAIQMSVYDDRLSGDLSCF